MKKIFVLDTNVLLHDPRAIFSFEDNDVAMREQYPALVGADRERARADVAYAAWIAWHVSHQGTDFSAWSTRGCAPPRD